MFSVSALCTYLKLKTHVTISHIVLYGCNARYPTLREYIEATGFENKELKRMSGHRRDGVAKGLNVCVLVQAPQGLWLLQPA
jgi:hypothetical protein